MARQNWNKIEQGVAAALDVAPAMRDQRLTEYCAGNDELRHEIDSLLANHDVAEGFLERSLAPYTSVLGSEEQDDLAGRQFGKYRIIREIGRGGMGAVFLAERTDGDFSHHVAIKIVRQTIAEKDLVNRFRRERQILASLNHPNIATLLDGGVSEAGEPFLVMEYILGVPLLDHAETQNLDLKLRLKLFLKICRAVAFAHQNLIVHRDIKPSNILVDDNGEPKLLDFGLAKVFDETLADDDHTQTAFKALTPAYASPEQLRGENVTTSSDVYSLGVVLYELLTGKRPYKLKSNSFQQVLRAVSTDEPTRPSVAVSSDSRSAAGYPQLKGDIDNIILLALRKEPERRYSSAAEFASDIERYLDGQPVSARPNTFGYRADKFIRRNKVAVAAAAAILIAVLGGLLVALWQADAARRQRDLANAEKIKAEKTSQFLSAALAYSDPSAGFGGTKNKRDATINEMLDDFAPRIQTELADQPDVRAALQRTVGLAYLSQGRWNEAGRYLNAAFETHLELFGEDHPETVYSLSGLAGLKTAKGEYSTALHDYERVADVYRRISPADEVHLRVFVGALVALGSTHWTRGNYPAADAAFTEAIAVAARLSTREREPLATAKTGLGMTRYAQGDLAGAIVLLREAVDEFRAIPGARWSLPDALNALGQALYWRGDLDESLAALRESEAISLEVLGENGYAYSRSLYLQAYTHCGLRNYHEALRILEKAEAVTRRFYSDNRVNTANLADARNTVLTGLGRAAEGERFGRLAVEQYESVMPRGTPSITLARINLANALISQKKNVEAEAVLRQAYTDATEGQGPEHWRTKYAAERLADFYTMTGRNDLAGKL